MTKLPTNYFIEFLCVAGMILSYYGYGALTFYIILTGLAIIVTKIFNQKIVFSFSKPFILFIICYFLLRSLHFSLSDIPLGTLLMVLFLGFFQGQVQREQFISLYNRVAKFNVFYLFVQIGAKLLFNMALPGVLLFLPLTGGTSEEIDVSQFAEIMADRSRFSGFFSEPSHLAAFLLPLIAINIFYKKDYINVFLFVVAILLSKSGVGLVGLVVILVFTCISRIKSMSARQIVPILVSSLFLSGAAYFVVSNGYADDLLDRQEEFDVDNENSSGFIRVVRGYYIFDMMTTQDKIIGGSNSTVKSIIDRSPMASSFARQGDMIYLNFFQRILIYGGIITAFFFILFYIKELRILDPTGKCCISIFFIISFMSGMNFNAQMLLMLTTAFMFIKKKDSIKKFYV